MTSGTLDPTWYAQGYRVRDAGCIDVASLLQLGSVLLYLLKLMGFWMGECSFIEKSQ